MMEIKSGGNLFDEEEQINLAKTDLRFFEPLYNVCYIPVFRYVYRHMENRDEASDITSAVFLKAMKNLPAYSYTSRPFLCWLFVIAKNEIAGFYRHRKTVQRYFAGLGELEYLSAETEFELHGNTTSLVKILEMLPGKDFELIELKYFCSKSIREITEITGMSENSIRVRLHRIRGKIAGLIRTKSIDIALMLAGVTVILLCARFFHVHVL